MWSRKHGPAPDERATATKPQVLASRAAHSPNNGTARSADQLGQLMGRYAKGEDGVFEELYRLLAPRVYRFCSRLATHQEEADDCFQETLLRIHRARATYLEGADTLPWAFAISRSVYLDRLRYRRRRPEDLGRRTMWPTERGCTPTIATLRRRRFESVICRRS